MIDRPPETGDLVKYRDSITIGGCRITNVYIVKRSECDIKKGIDWVFVYGNEVPIQRSLLKVISRRGRLL